VLTRRMFVAGAAGAGFALLGRSHGMSIHLSCGALGIKASQTEAIDYAARYGFDAVDADGLYLGDLPPSEVTRLLDSMRAKNVGWAIAGFPTEFRKDDAAFSESVKTLPAFAAALERAGVKRVTTWISPNSADLTYLANLKTHAKRLREAAGILKDHGILFGLEYVGPKTLWSTKRFPFVHTMAEMKELIAEIATVGVYYIEAVMRRIIDRFGLGRFDSKRAAAQVNGHSVRAAEKGEARAGGTGDEHTSREHHDLQSTPMHVRIRAGPGSPPVAFEREMNYGTH